MSKHLGDYDASTVIYGKFSTFRPSTGAAFTLGGTPALSVYKDNSTTQSTTGVTLTVDFDSVTGLHHYAIDTSADGTFYAAGSFFDIVITTGTVDSVSVVGTVVASFTLRKNSALKPATAGRTITVDASGRTDVGSFGGTAGTFSGGRPEVNTTHLAGQAVTAAAGVTFPTSVASPTNITAGTITTVTNLTNLPAITANWLTAAGIAAGALDGKGNWNIGKTGYSLTATTGLGNQTADITGSLSGSVGSVTGAVGSVTGLTASDVAAIKAKTDSLTFTVANKVDSNVLAIDGATDAADRLQKVIQGNVFGTCDAASSTTSIITSALDPAAAVIDQYKGRILTFKNDTTTANLRGQSTDITASTALGVLTVTALTTAPASGDTFTIS